MLRIDQLRLHPGQQETLLRARCAKRRKFIKKQNNKRSWLECCGCIIRTRRNICYRSCSCTFVIP